MSATNAKTRHIDWPAVVTVLSAATLIAAEVFGAAFAGGWAVALLFDLPNWGHYALQVIFFGCGVLVMIAFIRSARRIEPFTRER